MTDSLRPDWSGRLRRVHEHCAQDGLDALVVSALPNITYLCGFRGTDGLLVASGGAVWLLVDGRYEAAARTAIEAGLIAPVQVERVTGRYDAALAGFLERLGARRVGFEAGHVTVALLQAWQRRLPGVEWRGSEQLVERLRAIKDDFEIAALRRGARAIDSVAARLPELVARGRSEREVAKLVEEAMDRAGFAQPAFPTIVASGPNSGLPHARPTDRRLADGDLVVLDFGGVLDGYCTDITRMAAVGHVSPRAHALFRAVAAAQAAALAAIRDGVPSPVVDAAARDVLHAHELGEAFVHGTGHGIGLQVHEAPRVGRDDGQQADVLRAGMVCTIEPGAYVDGVGGVRLEDDVLVTAGGCEVLTTAPRDLLVV
jgi:Xaa-Pro aminopeptidase